MIPRFFQDMPPKKERRTRGKWRLEITAMFPLRDVILHSEVYEGVLWRAYLKIRIHAFKKDIETAGADYGIGWRISRES